MKLGLEKNIFFKGYVNGIEKYMLYLRSRMFLHTTVYDNNGMVAAEALCSGLPVVMYKHRSFDSIYTKGVVKVAKGDKRGFARKIIALIESEDFYSKIKISQESIEEIRNFWAWENRFNCLNLFKECK